MQNLLVSFVSFPLSPRTSVRLEGLSGLSVQDAELKLFADEKPESSSGAEAGKRSPSSSSSATSSSGAVGGEARDKTGNGVTAEGARRIGDQGNGESGGGGGKTKKKRKRGKKQAAVTQRGPLLITHTGAVLIVC